MSGGDRSVVVLWNVHGAPTVQRLALVGDQPFIKGLPVRDWKPVRWDGERYVVGGEGEGADEAPEGPDEESVTA